MNNLRNKVQLIGNLGKEVEFKQLDNGNALAKVTIATKEVYRNSEGEKVEDVQWHYLVGWGKVAEIMHSIMKKGQEVAIQGKLAHRSYEDDQGVKRYISEVVVSEFIAMS
jgi:single-strand DNA-binding protein